MGVICSGGLVREEWADRKDIPMNRMGKKKMLNEGWKVGQANNDT